MTMDGASDTVATIHAVLVCRLLASDPSALGGVVLRGPAGPVRDSWIAMFRGFLPKSRPLLKVPHHVANDRLLGGLDVAATLASGKPIAERGLFADADGGLLHLLSSERLSLDKASYVAAAMESGIGQGFGLVACDEGMEDDEVTPTILTERLAFRINLEQCQSFDGIDPDDLSDVARRAADLPMADQLLAGLSGTALRMGVLSLRPLIFAVRVARLIAALDEADEVREEDAIMAANLVLAHRARFMPQSDEEETNEEAPPPPPKEPPPEDEQEPSNPTEGELAEVILEAVRQALPPGLLEQLDHASRIQKSAKTGAGSLSQKAGKMRGRPAGTKRGDPRQGARLNLIETLRTAAPWQKLRRKTQPERTGILVSKDDFRVNRYKQKRETTAIFVVDASGSAAIRRMAEAKGAVEYILADCYVRRDRVALIAFRGKVAEILLPPTRSLQRARRSLADLPGGGGTPLAAAIDSSMLMAEQVRRSGGTPIIVFLTDGRANITRDGTADRPRAAAESDEAAKALRLTGVQALMIDLSENRDGVAKKLAASMGGIHLPLPYADAARISHNVSLAMKSQRGSS